MRSPVQQSRSAPPDGRPRQQPVDVHRSWDTTRERSCDRERRTPPTSPGGRRGPNRALVIRVRVVRCASGADSQGVWYVPKGVRDGTPELSDFVLGRRTAPGGLVVPRTPTGWRDE